MYADLNWYNFHYHGPKMTDLADIKEIQTVPKIVSDAGEQVQAYVRESLAANTRRADRSDLVALNVEDVEFIAKGALFAIRRSKTDQEGQGRKVAVPYGRTRHCPILALRSWLAFAGIEAGPIFLALNKHGHILGKRISG